MPSPSTTAEEKSPLLSPESPEEKYDIPEDTSLREHNRAVYQGVALLVKRWPDNVSSAWTPFIYLAFLTFILTLIFLSFVMVLSKMKFSVDLRFQVGRYNLHSNDTLVDFVISCGGESISTTRFPETVEHLSRSRFLQLSQHQPLVDPVSNSTVDDSIEPLGRVFFISREEDVTTEHLCSVESAANLLPNTIVYFVLLHNDEPETSHLTFFAENLQDAYKNLSVHRIGTKRYFSGSPLSETINNSSASKFLSPYMIELAARVVTLWRYGGVSVNSGVAVRNGSSFPGRDNATSDEVVLSETGSVISAGYQCHELLFQIMSTLGRLSNDPEHFHASGKEVISLAIKHFCANQTTTKSSGVDNESIECPGVSLLKSGLVCKSDDTSDTCLWKPVTRMLSKEKENLCPMTFEQFSFIY